MDLTHIAAIVLRQFYLIRGSLSRVLPLFVWAGIDIVLWGFITKYLNTVTPPGLNLVPSLLGAVLLWDFLIRVMQGVTKNGGKQNELDYDERRHADLLQGLGYRRASRVQPWAATKLGKVQGSGDRYG